MKALLVVLCSVLVASVGLTALPGISLRPSFGSDAISRATSANLIEKHEKKGIQCTTCHGTPFGEKISSKKETCIGCHGSYETLSKKSQIHKSMLSPHFEGGTGCNLCHNIHKPSQLLCGQCHNVDTQVP